jgi:hypothetical protein
MNARPLMAAALAATFALGASAQEATHDDMNFVRNTPSTRTRAEVLAEVVKARQDGQRVTGTEAANGGQSTR